MLDWLTISKTSGKGNAAISVSPLTFNTTGTARGCVIIATNSRNGYIAVMYVTQESIPVNTLVDNMGSVLLDSNGFILTTKE